MLIVAFPFRLHVALLPIILQLHQSQLDFLIAFFGAKGSLPDQSSDHNQNSGGAKPSATKNLAGHKIAVEALLPYFQASAQFSFIQVACYLSIIFFF